MGSGEHGTLGAMVWFVGVLRAEIPLFPNASIGLMLYSFSPVPACG